MYRIKSALVTLAALLALSGCTARANQEKQRAWSVQLEQRLRELGSSSREVRRLNSIEPTDDFDAYKDSQRRLLGVLDRYDASLARVQGILGEGLQGGFLDASSQQRYQHYVPMLQNQGRLSNKLREYANAVLAANPSSEPQPDVIARMESLQAELLAIQKDLAQSAKDAGVPFE